MIRCVSSKPPTSSVTAITAPATPASTAFFELRRISTRIAAIAARTPL